MLQQCAEKIKAAARKLSTRLRTERVDELKARIDGKDATSDQQLFKHLRRRDGTPTASIQDPSTGQQIFDINAQFKIMIEQWGSIFNMHKDSPPSFDDFRAKYGQYEAGQ